MSTWTKKQIKVKKKKISFVLEISFRSFLSISLPMCQTGLESKDVILSLTHWTLASGELLSTSMEFKSCANLVQYIVLLSNILYFKQDLTL